MDAELQARRDLIRLCHRHGLPSEAGERFLPLMRRALVASKDVRRGILEVVEAGLAKDAAERAGRRGVEEPFDRQCLVTLARILH
jgi:hypothetical protein